MGYTQYDLIHTISNTNCALHQATYMKLKNKLQSKNI